MVGTSQRADDLPAMICWSKSWKRGDAQLRSGVGNERDRFLGLIGCNRALRHRIRNAIFRAPGGKLASLHVEAHGRMLSAKDAFSHLCLGHCNGARWLLLIDVQGIVPWRRWEHLPVGGHTAVSQFYPGLTHAVREKKGAALDGNGIIEAAGYARIHGKHDLDAIARAPGALQVRETASR